MPRETEGRSFRYQKRSHDDLRNRATQRGGNYDTYVNSKFKMFKPHDGKNIIRILPPTWEDAKHYGYDIFVNYNVGADNQTYLSLSEMKKEADPLAEARKKAEREGDEELAKELKPKKRILMWVIDRMAEGEGPLWWAAPWTFDKDVANISFDEDTKDVVFIDDPESGCDLRFYKEGVKLTTSYDGSKMRLMKPSPIYDDEGLQQEWLDFIVENPLPSILQFYTYDEINASFNGMVGKRDDDKPKANKPGRDVEEDAEVPPRRTAGRTRPEPVDEEQDAAPPPRRRTPAIEPEDEEPEAPPSRASRARPAPEEEADAPPTSVRERLQAARRRPVVVDED